MIRPFRFRDAVRVLAAADTAPASAAGGPIHRLRESLEADLVSAEAWWAVEARPEAFHLEPLHRDVALMGLEEAVADVANDVRVLHGREHFGLAEEALTQLRGGPRRDLDGHEPTARAITAPIDDAEPPAPRDGFDVESPCDVARFAFVVTH
jgi:hypothetical protein